MQCGVDEPEMLQLWQAACGRDRRQEVEVRHLHSARGAAAGDDREPGVLPRHDHAAPLLTQRQLDGQAAQVHSVEVVREMRPLREREAGGELEGGEAVREEGAGGDRPGGRGSGYGGGAG